MVINDLILRLKSYFCREVYLNVYSVFGKIAVSGKLICNNSLSNETYPKQKKNHCSKCEICNTV